MTDNLQALLQIPVENLQAINNLLVDPGNRVVKSFLDIVRKYGTPEEINQKAAAARSVPHIMARLRELNSPYLKDLEWLAEQCERCAFVNLNEYRYQVLGHRADMVHFDESCYVALEISGFQYFPWLIAEAKQAIENREVMPGSFIRARRLKESEQDQGELLAVVAAMQIAGAEYNERIDTREMEEIRRLNTPGSIVRYLSGSTQLNEYAGKWLDEFLYYYTHYGVPQVINANSGTALLGYLLFRLGVNARFRISASLGTDNPFGILWALMTARLLARPDGTTPLAGLNLNDNINRETLEGCAQVRRALGLEESVGLEYHVTETWKNSVKQPYLRRAELVKLAWMIPNMIARHEGGDPDAEQRLDHPSDLFDYLRDKQGIEARGEMPLLERNYMEKHAALNRTARALTEDGLTILPARNLHSCPSSELAH
ncbi:MAG: hypothetical protein WCF84_17760 [Anaerolineae bacterium]